MKTKGRKRSKKTNPARDVAAEKNGWGKTAYIREERRQKAPEQKHQNDMRTEQETSIDWYCDIPGEKEERERENNKK